MDASHVGIVLVIKQRVLLDSLAYRFEAETDLRLEGLAADADEGLNVVLQTNPDVVVLDVDLAGRGPFEVVSELSRRQTDTKVVLLTSTPSDVFINQALKLNVPGYLIKDEPVDVFFECIRKVARGGHFFSDAVKRKLEYDSIGGCYKVRNGGGGLSSLTCRQLEVLRHLAKGSSVKEVARTMHLSQKSIDSHKYRIMHKLGIHDRVELARFTIREGLILP